VISLAAVAALIFSIGVAVPDNVRLIDSVGRANADAQWDQIRQAIPYLDSVRESGLVVLNGNVSLVVDAADKNQFYIRAPLVLKRAGANCGRVCRSRPDISLSCRWNDCVTDLPGVHGSAPDRFAEYFLPLGNFDKIKGYIFQQYQLGFYKSAYCGSLADIFYEDFRPYLDDPSFRKVDPDENIYRLDIRDGKPRALLGFHDPLLVADSNNTFSRDECRPSGYRGGGTYNEYASPGSEKNLVVPRVLAALLIFLLGVWLTMKGIHRSWNAYGPYATRDLVQGISVTIAGMVAMSGAMLWTLLILFPMP
jgi:hypothetical protein